MKMNQKEEPNELLGQYQTAIEKQQATIDKITQQLSDIPDVPENSPDQTSSSTPTPSSTSDSSTKPTNFSGGYQGAYDLAINAGFKPENARIMAGIAGAESSYKPGARNPDASTGDNSYGLWQINMLGGMGPERRAQFGIDNNDQLLDPATNAAAAKKIFDQQGFGAWSVHRSGAYRDFMQ